MLPNEDSVIYVDTDMIFLRPPEELWAQFNKFNSIQHISMASYMKSFAVYMKMGKVSIIQA